MAMPVQGPRSSVPSSERSRRSSWVPPCTMGQRVWRADAVVGPRPRSSRMPRTAAPIQPAQRPLHPLARELVRRLARHHVVERHGDVGAEGALDLHRALGRERARGAVHVALELDAVLLDPPQPLEREDLEAAGVGEHRPVPGGEAVEPAHARDDVLAGAEVQVIGVAEDDLRAGARARRRRCRPRTTPWVPTGMNAGRLDGAVGQGERAGARGAGRALEREVEHQDSRSHASPRSACDRSAAGAPGRAPPSA